MIYCPAWRQKLHHIYLSLQISFWSLSALSTFFHPIYRWKVSISAQVINMELPFPPILYSTLLTECGLSILYKTVVNWYDEDWRCSSQNSFINTPASERQLFLSCRALKRVACHISGGMICMLIVRRQCDRMMYHLRQQSATAMQLFLCSQPEGLYAHFQQVLTTAFTLTFSICAYSLMATGWVRTPSNSLFDGSDMSNCKVRLCCSVHTTALFTTAE